MLRFCGLTAILVGLTCANIVIYPPGDRKIFDLTTQPSDATVLFTCVVEDSPAGKQQDLRWYNINDNEILANSRFVLRKSTPETLSLLIKKPQEDDDGTYTCKWFANATTVQQESVHLMIYKGVRIESPKEQYIINGTDARVLCTISDPGDFYLSINWFRVVFKDNGDPDWKSIDQEERFSVHKPEVLTVEDPAYLEIKNVSLEDEHTYLCNVNIRDIGKSLVHYIKVFVTVPPSLPEDNLKADPAEPLEGQRLELTCEAHGTPSPNYTFTKYHDASKMSGEVVQENSKDGHFIIEHVKRGDEGMYQCLASNQGGSANRTVSINVRVPPQIVNPGNVSLEEGRDIRLSCQATGDPAPEVIWRRHGYPQIYTSDQSQDTYTENVSASLEMDANSGVFTRTVHLVMPKVRPHQAGDYVCEATNAVGSESQEFNLDVSYKPIFGDKVDSHFYGWVGSNTNLSCMANGNPTPRITWYKDDVKLKKDNVFDIAKGDTDMPFHVISYLTPKVSDDDDDDKQGTVFGAYKCEAQNIFGKNEVELTFKRAVVPDPPKASSLDKLPTTLKLQLQRPLYEGNQPVTTFVISYFLADPDSNHTMNDTQNVSLHAGEDSVEAEITGLTPNTKYNVSVSAVNNVGMGQPFGLTATTADYSNPGKVEVVSGRQGADDTSYTLKWKVPMTGGAKIIKYKLEYAVVTKVNTSMDPWVAVEVFQDSVTLNVEGELSTEVLIDRLQRDTYYLVKVKAVNRIGSSQVSSFIFKTGLGVGIGGVGAANGVQISAAVLMVAMTTTALHALF